MKTAVVGIGIIGKVHLDVLDELGVTPVAVCDINENKIKDITQSEKYTDYLTMLDSAKPEIVHICTPHYLHADMIIEALNRNINVLCEKPLCIKVEDIDRIIDAEKKSKAQLGVCHQNRYNPENVYVKEYIKDKKVLSGYGTVIWERGADYYAQDAWRGKWETEGGGTLINQALHTLDLMQWFVGFPQEVKATVSNLTLKNEIEVEDTASVLCSGNANFSFYSTNGSKANFPVTVTLRLENEIMSIFDGKVVTDSQTKNFKKNTAIYGKNCYGTGHFGLIKDFYDCVETGRKFLIDGSEASKVIRIILATYKSNGVTIKL